MAQVKLLVDSSSYFRLAKSIRPLLGQAFGKNNYCLYILNEFEVDLRRSQRLQTRFYWVYEEEYIINRKKKLNISHKKKAEINNTFDFIWAEQKSRGLQLSYVDIMCLASAFELNVIVITDDMNMLKLAKELKIGSMSSLELMKLMYDSNHIDKDKVNEIVEYWKYMNDIPANFKKDYKRLFAKIIKKK
jgi:hypothetical protein